METKTNKQAIISMQAPAAIGPYSQAILSDGLIFASGQLGMDTNKVFPKSTADQTRQSLENVKAILKEAGLAMEDVVKTTIFITDMNDFGAVNAVYGEYFQAPYPARSCIAVKALPLGAQVEIEVIAKA